MKYKIVSAIFLTVIVIGNCLLVQGQNQKFNINQQSSENYSEMCTNERSGLIAFHNAVKYRQIVLSNRLENLTPQNVNDTLVLDLFSDRKYSASIEKVSIDVNGTKSIRAKIIDYEYGYCVITISNGNVFMNIEIPELHEKYILRKHQASQADYLLYLNNNLIDVLEGGESLIPSENIMNSDDRTSLNDSPVLRGPNDPATIDLLIVYTPAASSWATTNEGGINNTIASLMEKSQLGLDNSNTGITLNLVYSAQVEYTEVDASTDLSRIQSTSDGYIDVVHTWRDTYAADVVVFLTLENNTGGLGYLLNNTNGSPAYGFSITRVQQASWTFTTIHEVGHNMGAHHHINQTTQPGPGLYSFSAGWRWTGSDDGKYCDIMTYESGTYFADGIDHDRVAYFSDPNISYLGQPTGNSTTGNNAQTLRETKGVVSNYRTSLVPTMNYVSSTTTQNNTTDVTAGTTNQEVIGIQIVTENSDEPISATSFSLNTTGTSNVADIYDAKLYYTSTSSSFALTNQFGSTVASPSGVFSFNGTQTLAEGANYFWLAYSVRSTATNNNVIDAQCTSITVDGSSESPSVSAPIGSRSISVKYNVTFNVTNNGIPIENAYINFNSTNLYTNASGAATFTGVEVANNLAYSITKSGFHPTNGALNVVNQNVTANISIMNSKAAINFAVQGSPTANTTTLIWDGSGATSYQIQYFVQGTTTYLFRDISSSPTTLQALEPSTIYNCRIRSLIDGVYTSYSSILSFTTAAGSSIAASGLAVQGSPTANTATLVWSGSGATSYQILYYKEGTTNYLLQNTIASPFTLQALEPSSTYRCKIRTLSGGVYTTYSSEISFTTAAGASIAASSFAVQGSPTANTATLIWSGSGATSYQIQYFKEGTTSYLFQNSTTSPITLYALEPSTTYNCRIRTLSGGVYNTYSSLISFTTAAGSSIAASSLAVQGSPTANTATLVWSGSGATGYQIQFFAEGSSNYQIQNASSSPYTLQALEPSTTYNCRIRTLSGGVYNTYSSLISFTTAAGSSVAASNLAVFGVPTVNSATLTFDETGASIYQIMYYKDGTSTYYYKNISSSPATLTGLAAGTNYSCKIRTYSNGMYTSFSNPVSFSTSGSREFELSDENGEQISEVNVYPNPFNNSTKINVKIDSEDACTLRLYDISGQFILEETIEPNLQLEIGRDLKPGVYILKVLNNKSTKTVKIIKTK
ncbi:MAG TPA: hypothetical protein DDX39_12285 [Bacteroidales bacterium]|nr:MAG: hypothetical protein A2W98_11690 [Bacteroidetes bacterium GWF2_33_38]HBF89411.1 hypothetical protein [Bacteroidales bacterium]